MGQYQSTPSIAQSVVTEFVARGDGALLAARVNKGLAFERDVEVQREVLGEGMNGDVRAAKRRGGGPPCAVKTLRTRGLAVAEAALVRSEVDILLSVDHPHIAKLFAVYEGATGDLHLVMEQLAGGEVFDRLIAKSRFPEDEAAAILVQMLLAISYLQGLGVVHRDLKLENFLFQDQDTNTVKLIDFGLARRWRPADGSMSYVCGSRDYMAPEVLARSYTQQADLWSVGIMAYTLLTGVLPWSANVSDVWKEIRAGKPYFHPELFPALSSEAQSFVRSLLTASPSERPTVAAALQHPWLSGRASMQAPSLAVVHNIRSFSKLLPLQRRLRTVAARQFGQQTELHSQFFAFGSGSTGMIRLPEFQAVLAGTGVSAGEASSLFDAVCECRDGGISLTQFLAASVDPCLFEGDVCQLTFAQFDSDCDGLVSVCDFEKMGFNKADIESCGLSLEDFSLLLSRPPDASGRQKLAARHSRESLLHRCAWCGSETTTTCMPVEHAHIMRSFVMVCRRMIGQHDGS